MPGPALVPVGRGWGLGGMGGVRFLGTQVDGGSVEVSDDIYT